MQFPVPQFTDVEDTIIASLTVTQFGLLFGAGMVVFLAYSATKSVLVLVFVFVLIGIPCLALAFGKLNGRNLYRTIPDVLKYLTGPKNLVFYKEANRLGGNTSFSDIATDLKPEAQPAPPPADPKARLAEVNKILEQKAREEQEILKQKM